MSLYETFIDSTREQVRARSTAVPLAEIRRAVAGTAATRSFYDALAGGFCVVGEHKRRSPTGGEMNAANVARCIDVYERTPWIRAISVLTDAPHFRGSLDDLRQIRARTTKPLLLKDFVIDEYQVWEARARGADAILLMTALHASDPGRLRELLLLARELGLDSLVELGVASEAPAELASGIPAEARICGINARRFDGGVLPQALRVRASRLVALVTQKDPFADSSRHATCRALIPPGKLAVAESGIVTADALRGARDAGYHAALIGTAFLKTSRDIESVIDELGAVFAPHARATHAAAGGH